MNDGVEKRKKELVSFQVSGKSDDGMIPRYANVPRDTDEGRTLLREQLDATIRRIMTF